MNNEEKLKQLRETIELAQKNIEELQKPKFEICRDGYYVGVAGLAFKVVNCHNSVVERAHIFKTSEVALKVDKILEPSRFIAQYVFEHAPDYVPDFDDHTVEKWYVDFNSGAYGVYYHNASKTLGVVYMPKSIAIGLCNILNSGEYKLTSDSNE